MLHAEYLESVRRMTPGERIAQALQLTDMAWQFLSTLTPEEEQRRLDLRRREPWHPPASVSKDRDG